MNKVILMGVLVADPEFSQTTSGIPVCRIRIAVDKTVAKGQERQSDFFRITAWRNNAEFVSRYFSKGNSILIEGSIHNEDYTDNNGVKHYSMGITADKLSFVSITAKDVEGKNSRSANYANNANSGGYGNGYQQQQPSYNNNNGGNFAPQNNNIPQNNYGSQQPIPQQPPVQNDFPSGSNLSDFEEVLSDGDVPF